MPTPEYGSLFFLSDSTQPVLVIPRRESKQHNTKKNFINSCNLTSEFNTNTVSLLVQQIVKQNLLANQTFKLYSGHVSTLTN